MLIQRVHGLLDTKDYAETEIVKSQRTERGLAYEKMVRGFYALKGLAKTSPKHKAMYDDLVADIESLRQKGVTPSSVHSNTFLTNMSVMYANDEYIDERLVTPVPVEKRSNTFAIYPQRERFEYP